MTDSLLPNYKDQYRFGRALSKLGKFEEALEIVADYPVFSRCSFKSRFIYRVNQSGLHRLTNWHSSR